MPPGIINRVADNWRPLIAIADAIGGSWPERARKACLAADPDGDNTSHIELLLGDIRDIFDTLAVDRISSAHLIEKLCEITPRPWSEFGNSGKPITQNKLARLLKGPDIGPKQVRIMVIDDDGKEQENQIRGYERSQFDEAFERYLAPVGPEKGVSNRHSVTNADKTGTSATSQSVTDGAPVTVGKSQKSNNHGLCDGVTVRKGGNGHDSGVGLSERTIEDIAEWLGDYASRLVGDPNIDAKLGQALRERLRNKYDVYPEHLETEAARVMEAVFKH
jgi:hypothetical protein